MGGRSPNAQRLVPCMPPLIDGEVELTNLSRKESSAFFSGTACELLVKTYFLEKGINVSEPHIDDGVDLLIQKPGEGWVRGQVKKVIYKSKLDYGMKSHSGKEVYRSQYDFRFQGSAGKGRRQRKGGEIDYFYHVLLTPYRQLIWETPVSLIPLRDDGTFVATKNPCLDRDNWKRKPSDIKWSDHLIYRRFDPIVFKEYPEFFLKPEQQTLEKFF